MKKQFIVLLSAILVLAFASTGVFADSLTPLPVVSDNQYNTLVSQGVMINSGSWYSVYVGSLTSNTSDLYVGAVPNPDISGYYTYYVASLSSGQILRYNNSASSTTTKSINGTDVPDVFYTVISTSPNLPTADCPIFPTLSDFLLAVTNPVTGEVVDFSISPGYALVIDGPCEIVERSYYINNSWNFTPNGNMRVNGAFENDLSATYIRDGYSPDFAYTRDDLIQWEALNPNLFGTASIFESYNGTLEQITDGETYVIGYPQLYGFGTFNSRLLYTNSVDLVGFVYINYSQRPTFRYVALESLSEFTNNGDFYTYSVFRPAVADVEGVVSSGSGGVVITPSEPLPSGGGNSGQPPVDEDSSLLGTISRFVNDIKRLLSSAVEAINTLVNDGSSFMQSIGTMFTWLPAPITTLIIAGFTVLLVVGVLKVLWR